MSCQISFLYDILLSFSREVTEHDFVLRCIPPSFPGQEILDESFTLDPPVPYSRQRDGFGNLLQIGRVEEPHAHFRYTLRGTARLTPCFSKEEIINPAFRYQTAFTALNRGMEDFFASLTLPADNGEKIRVIAQAVHEYMSYMPGATTVHTTAAEAFALRRGVCQDYAHIFLALARRAGFPARYCSGLIPGEGASHAWCEVWYDGIWHPIDPTRMRRIEDGYLRICIGRDFSDCPIERGVFRGSASQTQTVTTKVTQL